MQYLLENMLPVNSDDSDGFHDAEVAGNTLCSVCVKMHI